MKKYLCSVIILPAIIIIISYTTAYLEHYTSNSIFLDIFAFAWIYGILILNPLMLLAINIYCTKRDIVKSQCTYYITLIVIAVVGLISQLKSILVYLGIENWSDNDVDLLPLYILVPSTIYVVSYIIYLFVQRTLNRHDKR